MGEATWKPEFFPLTRTPGVASAWSTRNPGAREGRQGDEEHPRVVAAAGRLRQQELERKVESARQDDEPEVGRMVFPVEIEPGNTEEKEEARQRRRHEDGPRQPVSQRSASSSRGYSSPS